MTNRYMSFDDAARYLRMGRSVEQWLGATEQGDLRWLALSRNSAGRFVLKRFAVEDDRSVDSLDVYAFTPLDPDDEFETMLVDDDELTVLRHAVEVLGAQEARFVNPGLMQVEYADALALPKRK